MLNVIKMDLYRMIRTKSLYIIWFIAAVCMLGTTYILKSESLSEEIHDQSQQEVISDYGKGEVALGIMVMTPIEPGEKVTVKDVFYGNAQSKFYALFFVIFTVLFAMADINSGYIKNIGGQIKSRGSLIIAKAVSLLVYTILSMFVMVLIQIVSNMLVLGYVEIGNIKDFFAYMGIQTLLYYALCIICMAIAIILKSNVASMVIVICLCMNMFLILYSAIDKVLGMIGVKNFNLFKYTVTGRIAMVSQNPTGKECFPAAVVAISFIVACTAVCVAVFRKRDM